MRVIKRSLVISLGGMLLGVIVLGALLHFSSALLDLALPLQLWMLLVAVAAGADAGLSGGYWLVGGLLAAATFCLVQLTLLAGLLPQLLTPGGLLWALPPAVAALPAALLASCWGIVRERRRRAQQEQMLAIAAAQADSE